MNRIDILNFRIKECKLSIEKNINLIIDYKIEVKNIETANKCLDIELKKLKKDLKRESK